MKPEVAYNVGIRNARAHEAQDHEFQGAFEGSESARGAGCDNGMGDDRGQNNFPGKMINY